MDERAMDETTATTTWIAVLDRRKGRLFEARRLPTGRLHLEEHGSLSEAWDEKQHHRPYMLSAHGRTLASFQHEEEERVRRFGKQAAEWLDEQVRRQGLARITVFCSPSLVGRLRKSLRPRLLERVDLRQEDLAWFTPGQLADHPAITEALG